MPTIQRIRNRGNGHWQIIGQLLVNWYPKTKTIYVAGTKAGYHGNIEQAIEAANKPPERAEVKDERWSQNKNRKVKRRLLRRDAKCYWCKCPLTQQTGTLDHLIPLDRGGLNNENNIVLACDKCNKDRGNSMPELGK